MAEEELGDSSPAGALVFSSSPKGVSVTLKGNSKIVGRTPFEVNDLSERVYEVFLSKEGYESQSGWLSVFKGDDGRWAARSVSYSRLDILFWSALLPGWGQLASGEKAKGVVLEVAGIGAMAAVVLSAANYGESLDKYNLSVEKYNNATSVDEIELRREAMQRRFDDVEDAYDQHQLAVGLYSGVWLLNMLDAALFFPKLRVDVDRGFLNFNLLPKKRHWAVLRSLILPGWGQHYSGRKTKGVVTGLVQLGSVATSLWIHKEYLARVESYRAAKRKYSTSVALEDIERYRREMIETNSKANEAYRYRQFALGLTIGLWIYNVLDSAMAFEYAPPGKTYSFDVFADEKGIGIAYSF